MDANSRIWSLLLLLPSLVLARLEIRAPSSLQNQVAAPPAGSSTKPVNATSTLRKLTHPGKRWSLVLDLPGFEFEERETRRDMTGVRVFGTNKSTKVIISVFLERAVHEGDARACREFYQRKGRGHVPPGKDIRLSERRDMALVEYTFDRFKGIDVNQRNVNAYLSHDGVWIDIHLSKPEFEPEDQWLFDAILDSVRILEAAPSPAAGSPAPSSASSVSSTQSFPAPGEDVVLTLNTLGATLTGSLQYAFDEKEGQLTGQRVVGSHWEGGSDKTGMVFTVAIGEAARDGDAKACREYYWRPLRYMPIGRRTDVRLYERGEMAIVEFTLPKVDGKKVDVKNILAFLSRDGIWIAIRLAKVDFKPMERAVFETVLESIRIDKRIAEVH